MAEAAAGAGTTGTGISLPAHSRAPPGDLRDLDNYDQLGVVGFGSYGSVRPTHANEACEALNADALPRSRRVVFLAKDKRTGDTVAIKKISLAHREHGVRPLPPPARAGPAATRCRASAPLTAAPCPAATRYRIN